MDEEELEDFAECWDCGETVSTREPNFAIGLEAILCFECALRRGGKYDATYERWSSPPNMADLPDERRAES